MTNTPADDDLAEFDTTPEEIEQVLGIEQVLDEDDEDEPEQFDPYEVPVENVDVHFITKVEGVENLGEAFETASLNLITHGIGSYFVLLTDRDSGREWVAHGGLVGNVGQEEDFTETDLAESLRQMARDEGTVRVPRRTEDVNLPD